MIVDVSAWCSVGWLDEEGVRGGVCCRLYRDNHTISIFKPINLLFVRLANRWGPRGGILRTDREQVNKITRPLLHVKPVLMCWTIGRETVTIRQKKCTCCVLYPVGDGRSFLLFRACFFPPRSRLDKKTKQVSLLPALRSLLRRGACEQKRRHGREPRRDRFSRRCAAPGGDVTV